MPGRVENGNNQYRIVRHLVDDAVGKPIRKNPADIPAAMATGGKQGVAGQRIDCVKYSLDKFTAQPCLLFFIPGCGIADISLRLRAQKYPETHRTKRACNRALTSSQGMADAGSRSCSASRESRRCFSSGLNSSSPSIQSPSTWSNFSATRCRSTGVRRGISSSISAKLIAGV